VSTERRVDAGTTGSGGLGSGIRVLARNLAPAPRLSTSAGRRENLLALLHELRHADAMTRTDLAQLTGLAIPTVHRLLAALLEGRLVVEEEATRATGGLGRPASLYRFDSSVASVAGVDVGNETTRVAVAAANGTITGSTSLPTAEIAENLAGGIVSSLTSLVSGLPLAPGPMVGLGVGMSASVHPATGRLARAPIHHGWDGLPLQAMLADRVSCPVVVEQDDHLSALAELSDRGTAPGAPSLVVVNYGRGIGAGVVVDGALIRGAHGRAGRIADWPASRPDARTLGQQLLPDAMTTRYRRQGGAGNVADGATLCQAARAGDLIARSVVDSAAAGIAEVFQRLAAAFDPQSMVLGGGFAGSFDLFDHAIKLAMSTLPDPTSVTPSVIASEAVLLGGLIAADPFVEKWLAEQVSAL
jgi:predicted NBD/HSP70 family sugar kinase/DNA-binding transcriptional ArsR family regulator